MKKIIVVLAVLLTLVGCNKKIEGFPKEELNGCYAIDGGKDYFTFENKEENLIVTYGNYDSNNSGKGVVESVEEQEDGTYNVSINFNGGVKTYVFDVSKVSSKKITINDKTYKYVSSDLNTALNNYKEKIKVAFFNCVEGFWNSDEDDNFMFFGKNNDGIYFNTTTWSNSDGAPSGWLTTVTKDYEEFNIEIIYPTEAGTERYLATYTFLLNDETNKTLVCNGKQFHYAGSNINVAYLDHADKSPR